VPPAKPKVVVVVKPDKPAPKPVTPATPATPDCKDAKNAQLAACKKKVTPTPTTTKTTLTPAQLSDKTRPGYDCKKDPTVILNWDGDCVHTTDPWYDDSLFTIADFDFTLGDALLTTLTIIVLSAIGFGISSYIAWKKRKAIAAGARRMSQSIVRASVRIRQSIYGKQNKIGNVDGASSDDDPGKSFGITNEIKANKD